MKTPILQSLKLCSVSVMIALTLACSQKPTGRQTATTSRPFTPPAQPYKFDHEDGQWPMPAKNYASTRFSGLSEINTGNVNNLKVAWTFATGATRGHEAAPIVAVHLERRCRHRVDRRHCFGKSCFDRGGW